jgi:hypothetical protein
MRSDEVKWVGLGQEQSKGSTHLIREALYRASVRGWIRLDKVEEARHQGDEPVQDLVTVRKWATTMSIRGWMGDRCD